MSHFETVADAISHAYDTVIVGEEPVWPDDTDEWGAEDLAHALSILSNYQSVIRALRQSLVQQLGEKLGEGGAMRYGVQIYRMGRKTKLTVLDPDGFAQALGSDVSKVFRLSGDNLRKTALRAVAADREVDEEVWYDTFTQTEDQGFELSMMPMSKAPKFLQQLEDGEIRKGRA